jgi:hypothetical protein
MKQFFSLLFLFVFVSGLSLAQNQPVLDKGAFSVLNPKPHIINQTNDTPLEEIFGLNQNMFGPSGMRGRGNIFLCTTPRKLVEHRMYLNPAAGTNLWFVVYEGSTFNGTYNLVNSVNFPNSGPGEGWYSSGPIEFDLQAGKYYMIYALFDLNGNYWNQQNITPYPIDCSFGQLVSGVGWQWSPVYNNPPNPTETPTEIELSGVAYYQTIVTDDIGGGNTFTDNFDSYLAGQQLACQNPTDWTTWSNLPCDPTEDPYVSSNHSYSSPNSVVIVQNNDCVKPLGNQTSGKWYISFVFYIPTGKSGYFNTLTGFTPDPYEWAFDSFFDVGGAGRLDITGGGGGGTVVNFNWTVGAWNQVVVIVDLDSPNSPAEYWIGTNPTNLTMVATWDWTNGGAKANRIAANDIFGAASTDEMYMDNYYFGDAMPPIIPVELTSFTAISNNGVVQLNWQTATEVNNHMFEIERKAEASEFITIGYVEGSGTTTEPRSYSYTDNDVNTGTYVYRLKQIDFNGTFTYSNEVEVDVTAPLTFNLGQNYPNPFNPSTKINYSVPEAGNVKLAVYNIVGEEVAVLVNGYTQAGSFDVTFNASNLPSGVYLYKLQSANSVQTKKMILLK